MSNKYNSNSSKFPETIYSSMNKETNYKCQGSSCSCKYLNNRTEFDKIENNINNNYLFDSSKVNKNSYKYKPTYKHFGI